MRRIITLLLSVAAIAATSELASARDGCGAGRFWNGYRCAPIGWRYQPQRPYPYNYGYAAPSPYGRTPMNGPCPYGLSLQDGVCKPYRGY
jgi:hypothetical protein